MEAPELRLRRALHLEEKRILSLSVESNRKREHDKEELLASLGQRGFLNSGLRLKQEAMLQIESTRSLIKQILDVRRKLSVEFPDLLTNAHLDALSMSLNRIVDGTGNLVTNFSQVTQGGGAEVAISAFGQRRVNELRAYIEVEISILRTEGQLGMNPLGNVPVTTINISHNANVNLGTVMGDMTGSIQRLNEAGQAELAEAIRKLSDAIVASNELEKVTQKEILEHLGVVSDEAAKPPEKRKMGPLKTSLQAISSGIATATQLIGTWQGIEHLLRAAGISF
jgi:hypothetical protein